MVYNAALKKFSDIKTGTKESYVHHVTEKDVESFGQLSGDLNPLHMDEQFAAATPFQHRVVHGMFVASLISTTHTNLTGPGFVYVSQDLNFKEPVYIGDKVEVILTVTGKKEGKAILLLETVVKNQHGRSVLEGKSVLMELARLKDRKESK